MKKTITTYFILLSITLFAQNSKTLEGYYNLSEFEMPAHLYLLDNGQFYYSAIFGAVDLEIYGTYTIEDSMLQFHPQEDQMQTFVLYGRKNENLKETIAFNYYKPENSYQTQMVFGVDKQWVKKPSKQADKEEIEFTFKTPQVSILKIGYPMHFDGVGNFFQVSEVSSAKIPQGINDFKLFSNRYADMRKKFAKNSIQLKGNNIVSNNKTRQKQPLKEGEKEKIKTFIKDNKMFEPTIKIKENTFQMIVLKNDTSQLKLKANKNGQLEELLTYTKNGKVDKNGNYYYKNDKLEKIKTIQDIEKEGKFKSYYESGELNVVGEFKDGLGEGKWEMYYKNGQLKSSQSFNKGKQIGKHISFFQNGQQETTGSYNNNGEKTGEWKSFFENGKLYEIGIYKNDKRVGVWKSYYKNGQLKEVLEKKGYLKIGEYKLYNEDGTIKEAGFYNKKGKPDGYWKTNQWGGFVKTGTYVNGKPIGEHKSFYIEGELYAIDVYNNTIHSLKKYYRNGQLREIGIYKNEEKDGQWKTYFENGKIKSSCNYKQNKEEGEYNRYSKNGQLEVAGNYKNGEKTGEWKYYKNNGLIRIEIMSENANISEIKYYKNEKLIETIKIPK